MTAPILIWEQHAGQPPVQHAETRSLDAVPDVIRAWLDQFHGRPVVPCWHFDGLLVTDVSGTAPVTIAILWIEYPDDILTDMVSHRLDARWRGPRRGMTWDTRDGVKRRVTR